MNVVEIVLTSIRHSEVIDNFQFRYTDVINPLPARISPSGHEWCLVNFWVDLITIFGKSNNLNKIALRHLKMQYI